MPEIQHERASAGDWRSENGYTPVAPHRVYPVRAHSAGLRGGIVMVLQHRRNDYDHMCRGPSPGFKVAFWVF